MLLYGTFTVSANSPQNFTAKIRLLCLQESRQRFANKLRTMTKPVGIALIGTGGIAQGAHLPVYQKLQDEGKVKIVALCDIKEDVLRTVSAKYGTAQTFTDYTEMLRLTEIDAIDVCTPNYLHKQPVIDSFAAGKHVLCEKPLAINAVEGEAMVAAGHAAGKKFQVGLNMRFAAAPQAIKRFADDGVFGEIYYARAQALRRRGVPSWGVFTQKDKQGGGPLIDIGVHILDLTLWLMGHPKPVSATGMAHTKFGHKEGVYNTWGAWDPKIFTVEDFATGFVRFENGATLTLESSFIANGNDAYVTQLYGTEGGVFVDPVNAGNTKIFREESRSLSDSTLAALPNLNSHEEEIRAFVQAIADDTPVAVTGEQGLMVTRLLDAIYESSETGREVRF